MRSSQTALLLHLMSSKSAPMSLLKSSFGGAMQRGLGWLLSDAMPLRDDALALLRTGSNSPAADFRDEQFEAIEHVVEGHQRLLVVQRTGWGKSFVYFIATALLRARGGGVALLISPLLAL